MAKITEYETAVESARRQFGDRAAAKAVLGFDAAPDLIHRFLIRYCALGVAMTEPVDGWIRRAGQRCLDLGHTHIGHALLRHAEHEAGHHKLMIADTRSLVSRWNEQHDDSLDADVMLSGASTVGVERYRELHERVIDSPSPYAQLAIEYEIEMLSVTFGPKLIKHSVERLGPAILDCLSFVRDHVALDVGHTHFNARELELLLNKDPFTIEPLVAAGRAALGAYGDFVDDCLKLALS
ncbi:MAG: hypothetical protein ACXVJT_17370 [Thermoanaerobaculia bacterium]